MSNDKQSSSTQLDVELEETRAVKATVHEQTREDRDPRRGPQAGKYRVWSYQLAKEKTYQATDPTDAIAQYVTEHHIKAETHNFGVVKVV